MEAPNRPWQRLVMDLLLHSSKRYILIADNYSNLTNVQKLSVTSTKDIISAVELLFLVPGTPKEVICDNGTLFSIMEYKEFAVYWEYTFTTCSPHYP